jgi:hypothetical protein
MGDTITNSHSTEVSNTALVSLTLAGTCEALLPGFSATSMAESGVVDARRLLSDFFFDTRNLPWRNQLSGYGNCFGILSSMI